MRGFFTSQASGPHINIHKKMQLSIPGFGDITFFRDA